MSVSDNRPQSTAMTIIGSDSHESNLVMKNSIFSGNFATKGALTLVEAFATIINCSFINNTAVYYGGGCFLVNNAQPKFDSCNFTSNLALQDGGAMFISMDSVPVMNNCQFVNNSASNRGGAIRTMGHFAISNSNFSGNTAQYGGAVFFDGCLNLNQVNCSTLFNHTRFVSNQASDSGGAFCWETFAPMCTTVQGSRGHSTSPGCIRSTAPVSVMDGDPLPIPYVPANYSEFDEQQVMCTSKSCFFDGNVALQGNSFASMQYEIIMQSFAKYKYQDQISIVDASIVSGANLPPLSMEMIDFWSRPALSPEANAASIIAWLNGSNSSIAGLDLIKFNQGFANLSSLELFGNPGDLTINLSTMPQSIITHQFTVLARVAPCLSKDGYSSIVDSTGRPVCIAETLFWQPAPGLRSTLATLASGLLLFGAVPLLIDRLR